MIRRWLWHLRALKDRALWQGAYSVWRGEAHPRCPDCLQPEQPMDSWDCECCGSWHGPTMIPEGCLMVCPGIEI